MDNRFIQVKDHSDMSRDSITGMILIHNNPEKKREIQAKKKQIQREKQLEERVSNLENKLDTIISLLSNLNSNSRNS